MTTEPIPRGAACMIHLAGAVVISLLASCGDDQDLGRGTGGDLVPGANSGGSSSAGVGGAGTAGASDTGGTSAGGGSAAGAGGDSPGAGGSEGLADSGADADAQSEGGLDATLPDDTLLCAGPLHPEGAVDVWSDQRGPFAHIVRPGGPDVLWARAGGTWRRIHSENAVDSSSLRGLTGIPGGPLILHGAVTCGIRFIENGVSKCSAGVNSVSSLFVLGATQAYASHIDHVLVYDGVDWRQMGSTVPPGRNGMIPTLRAVWADTDRVVVAAYGDGDLFLRSSSGSFALLSPPEGRYRSVWGFEGGDIWAGDRTGNVVSYDAAGWYHRARIVEPCDEDGDEGIVGMWGAGNAVYVHTRNRLAVVEGGGLRLLRTWPCDESIQAIWGNAPTDVYVAALEAPPPGRAACGSAVLLHFDGSSFTQL